MAKKIAALAKAEKDYTTLLEKVKKLESELAEEKKILAEKEKTYNDLKREDAMSQISSALFKSNGGVSDERLADILEYITKSGNVNIGEKVATNGNSETEGTV